ncbi:MAG: YaaA family protein [Porphyromonadaceae bacterium]|nr:YaaA family protein [Porphyromonadaceae bacterium]
MVSIISPAKTFATKVKKGTYTPDLTQPQFIEASRPIVEATLALDKACMVKQFSLSPKKADEAYRDWRAFISSTTQDAPTLQLYSGMVFKKIDSASFCASDWLWANEHLLVCSFVYGLLLPTDGIRAYRMEGSADLGWDREESVFEYWRDQLTPWLISRVQASGGTLFYLASEEMKQLFHWAEVERSIRVISPRFITREPSGKLKQIVIYTKMARGAMVRHIIQNRIEDPEKLREFSPEGFVYSGELSRGDEWVYILEQ